MSNRLSMPGGCHGTAGGGGRGRGDGAYMLPFKYSLRISSETEGRIEVETWNSERWEKLACGCLSSAWAPGVPLTCVEQRPRAMRAKLWIQRWQRARTFSTPRQCMVKPSAYLAARCRGDEIRLL